MPPRNKNLTATDRIAVVAYLLRLSVGGRLRTGDIKAAADNFGRHRNTIARVWKRHKETASNENPVGDVRSLIAERSGRKKADRTDLLARFGALPTRKRTTLRRAASILKVSRAILRRLMAAGEVRRHTIRIHPQLTELNRLHRVKFALSHVQSEHLLFDGMYDVVHVDEKWYNQDKDTRNYYLLKDEEPPHRVRKSKRFIGKTMFLCAVARPRKNFHIA